MIKARGHQQRMTQFALSISRPLMLQPQVDASYEEQLCHRLSNLILQNRHQVVAEAKGL